MFSVFHTNPSPLILRLKNLFIPSGKRYKIWDCIHMVLNLNRALDASLVTGDRRLNELAKAQGVPVHGVLWILDEMVIHHVLTENQAAIALREMLDQGARLPDGECQKRFDRWSS
ncbi:MAG: hypothetical protein HPY45_17915 [Anaerolineae bacterium]|nr:hypothetical protein [Anaerolineae bacterium]